MSQSQKPHSRPYLDWLTLPKESSNPKISNHNDNHNKFDHQYDQGKHRDRGQQRCQGHTHGNTQPEIRVYSDIGLGSGYMRGNTRNPFLGGAEVFHQRNGDDIVDQRHGEGHSYLGFGGILAAEASNSSLQDTTSHVRNMIDQRADGGYGEFGFDDMGGNARKSFLQSVTAYKRYDRYDRDEEEKGNYHPQNRGSNDHPPYQSHHQKDFGFKPQCSPPQRDVDVEHGDFLASQRFDMAFNTPNYHLNHPVNPEF